MKVIQPFLMQELLIETYLNPDQLNDSTVFMIEEIGPFGEANPEPILAIDNVKIVDIMAFLEYKL